MTALGKIEAGLAELVEVRFFPVLGRKEGRPFDKLREVGVWR
jgi:hypothetical protein